MCRRDAALDRDESFKRFEHAVRRTPDRQLSIRHKAALAYDRTHRTLVRESRRRFPRDAVSDLVAADMTLLGLAREPFQHELHLQVLPLGTPRACLRGTESVRRS